MTARTISHEALDQLSAQLPEPVIALDSEERICVFNAAAERAFGVAASDVLGRSLLTVTGLAELLPLRVAALSGEGTARAEVRLPGGSSGWAQMVIVPEQATRGLFKNMDDRMYLLQEVVHSLNVPITVVKGFIDLIIGFGELNARQMEYAQRAQIKLLNMSNQVYEVLDTFWMESGAVIHSEPTDIVAVVRQVAASLADLAAIQGVELDLDLPDDKCVIMADAVRLQHAIGNLVHNAIKYSPDGGQVSVAIHEADHRVSIRVADHGIGIAPEYLPRIFDLSYRVRVPETQRIEGSGLGLALVKTVIEKHKGTVSVESTPGQGSAFELSLPAE
jgi:signal transduction histidine kinase